MIEDIYQRQYSFQKFIDFPVDSNLEDDRNEMSEKFVFKLIEESIELRKEFPSMMNPWSKSQKQPDLIRIKEELSDVFLFFINFLMVWKIDFGDFTNFVKTIQDRNFQKIKEKKMKSLNDKILSIPGYTSGIGSGCLSPKYIFVGQNPGNRISHGYQFWSNPEDGSSKILLPILDKLGIRNQSYFTNIVKSTTVDNIEPTSDEILFWQTFLDEEMAILKTDCKPKIVSMGNFVKKNIKSDCHITHPAAIIRGLKTKEEYEREISNSLALNS